MHDLKANFDKILPIVKQTLSDQLDMSGNLPAYLNKPDLPDTHIITLSLLQEALSIDSEHWYWSKLQTDYTQTFPNLPHLTNYNRRRKYLAGSTEQLASMWARRCVLMRIPISSILSPFPLPILPVRPTQPPPQCP